MGGVGLGDALEVVGLEVRVHFFSTFWTDFFDTGAIDLHLHRQLPAGCAVEGPTSRAVELGGPPAVTVAYTVHCSE